MSKMTTTTDAPATTGLDGLVMHRAATVVSIREPTDAHERELVLRLVEIGFLPGEPVRVIARGFPGGEPLAVRVGSSTFALRRHEAALVQVQVGADAEAMA